jgi:hypothetical protein
LDGKLESGHTGLIEGITEWLPISSTGHMILADEFIRLGVSPAFKEMFWCSFSLAPSCRRRPVLGKAVPAVPRKSPPEKGRCCPYG